MITKEKVDIIHHQKTVITDGKANIEKGNTVIVAGDLDRGVDQGEVALETRDKGLFHQTMK